MGLVNSVYHAFLKDRNGLNKILMGSSPCRERYCSYNKRKDCVVRSISMQAFIVF